MLDKFLLAKWKIIIHCFLLNHRWREVTRYYGAPPKACTYNICLDCGYLG